MMELFTILQKDTYTDSLASLFTMSVLMECEGIESAYAGMATASSKQTMEELGLVNDTVRTAGENDFIIAARAASREAFEAAMAQTKKDAPAVELKLTYSTVEEAVRGNPRANICSIAVPGEYACEVTKQALELGLHCIVFSANVPLEQEREMKELAREKGLLCMGPD